MDKELKDKGRKKGARMGPGTGGGNGAEIGKEPKMGKGFEVGTRIKVLSGIYKRCEGTVIEKAVLCEFDKKYTVQKVEIKTLEHGDVVRYMPEVTMLAAV